MVSAGDLVVEACSLLEYREGELVWNSKIKRKDLHGAQAGHINSSDGYRYVKFGKHRKAIATHRVVFFMHHGYLPKVIDHINRQRSDNRIENLRDALCGSNNLANQSRQSGTTSIHKGVCWDASRQKWSAYIKKDGVTYSLGRYTCEHQAGKAYNSRATQIFGDFAYLNDIPSDESIAAQAKEEFIDELVKITCIRRGEAALIYEAGYRKQVTE